MGLFLFSCNHHYSGTSLKSQPLLRYLFRGIMKPVNENQPNLKTLRESIGKTQRVLSYELNVALSTIGYWEAGAKMPSADKFVALASSFGVSLKTLARAMNIDASRVPDDFPDIETLVATARDRNKSIRQVVIDAGYDVTGIPED